MERDVPGADRQDRHGPTNPCPPLSGPTGGRHNHHCGEQREAGHRMPRGERLATQAEPPRRNCIKQYRLTPGTSTAVSTAIHRRAPSAKTRRIPASAPAPSTSHGRARSLSPTRSHHGGQWIGGDAKASSRRGPSGVHSQPSGRNTRTSQAIKPTASHCARWVQDIAPPPSTAKALWSVLLHQFAGML